MNIRLLLVVALSLVAGCKPESTDPPKEEGCTCKPPPQDEIVIVPCPLTFGGLAEHTFTNRTPDQVFRVQALARTIHGGGDVWTTAEVRINGVNVAADCWLAGAQGLATQDVTFILPGLPQ